MNDKQPEALRLADALDERVVPRWIHATGEAPQQAGYARDIECAQAAAELRRLHEENQQWKEECDAYIKIHDAAVKVNERLHEVNAELLASVKELLNCIQTDRDWDEGRRARAAIAKATGEQP